MDAWLSNKETIRKSKRYYAHFDVKTDIGHVIMFRIRNLLQCMASTPLSITKWI